MQNPGYIALSRQVVLERQLAVVANNIANMDTVGFKRQGILFGEHLATLQDGSSSSYVADLGTTRDVEQGTLRRTERTLDVAIEGDGYFPIQSPAGVRYTRNGQFQLSPTGDIVTNAGFPLLDDGDEPINIPANAKEIVIQKNGQVLADGRPIAKFELTDFDNPQGLVHTANGLYRADFPGEPAEEWTVRQGMVEDSNVNPVTELVYMLSVQRNHQAGHKMVTGEHDRLTRAIREIGKVDQA